MAASTSTFGIDATCAIFEELKDADMLNIFRTAPESSLDLDSMPWDWPLLEMEPVNPPVAIEPVPRRSRKQSLEERKEQLVAAAETEKAHKKLPKYALPIEEGIPPAEKKSRIKAARSYNFREMKKLEREKDQVKILALEKRNADLEERNLKLQKENDELKKRFNL